MAVTPRVPHDTPMWEDAEQTRMSRTWIIFFERIGSASIAAGEDDRELKATFGLVRELTTDEDLTLHYIVQKPGRFIGLLANGKQPCTGATGRIVIEKWHDDGNPGTDTEWVNIFVDRFDGVDTIPGYIELADADDAPSLPLTYPLEIFSPYVTASPTNFKEGPDGAVVAGDLLRINCTQVGSTFAGKGYEIVLRWNP